MKTFLWIGAAMGVSLSLFLSILAKMTGEKTEEVDAKLSSYECGFTPVDNARLPFSMQFFLVTILFLVFDVEICLLIPALGPLWSPNYTATMISVVMFCVVLLVGLFYEWRCGALDWF